MMQGHISREDSLHAMSYDSLQQQTSSLVHCEFCDEVFKTRLANIKHNAAHIIIPLIKLILHQCDECMYQFTSLQKLKIHVLKKNHRTSQFPDSTQHTRKLSINEYRELLQSIVENQVAERNSTLSLNEVRKHITRKSLNVYTPTYVISSDSECESPEREHGTPRNEQRALQREQDTADRNSFDITPEKEQWEELTLEKEQETANDRNSFEFSSLKNLSSPRIMSPNYEPVRSRLMFEDDDDDLFEAEEILLDNSYPPKTTQNSYIIESNLNNSINECQNGISLINRPHLLNGISVEDSKKKVHVGKFKSVHYDELIGDELCECRYCGRCFSNRFALIRHECTHMRLKQTRPLLCCVCERYLSGNYRTLRKHMEIAHPGKLEWKLQVHKCNTCHLKYHDYLKHVSHYHQTYTCEICKRNYDKEQLQSHDCTGPDNSIEPDAITSDMCKVIKMCEICLAFCKNRQNIHYEVIGQHSEVGAVQNCDRCHNKCFEVNLVKRKITSRDSAVGKRKKQLPMSNKDRLKKMQNRLKMVNKMYKC